MNPLSPLGQEWTTLQNNHEQYERSSLLIKLSAVFFSLLGLMFDFPALYLVAMLLILWLMEGIFRTSQSRLGHAAFTAGRVTAPASPP
jgi:lipopolysaccharide/colanic/teichoic acid biosynthesis glycosyltransferase